MKKIIGVLALLCLPVLAHAGISNIVTPSRLARLYVSPISYALQTDTKAEAQFGAGIDYAVGPVLGFDTALKFEYSRGYDCPNTHYGRASVVLYFN